MQIIKRTFVFFLLYFLLSCSSSIGVLQSQLVTLSVECEKGIVESCHKIPERRMELNNKINAK